MMQLREIDSVPKDGIVSRRMWKSVGLSQADARLIDQWRMKLKGYLLTLVSLENGIKMTWVWKQVVFSGVLGICEP